MSRALGDLMGYYDAGISAEPTLSEMQLKKGDDVLMMCSDGVWEFLSDSQVWDIIHPLTHGPNRDAQKAAEKLAKEAWDQWMRSSGGRHYGAHRCPRLIDSSHFLRKTSVYNIFEIFEIFLFFEFFSYF